MIKQKKGNDQVVYAKSLYRLGVYFESLNYDYDLALEYYNEAAIIQEKLIPNSFDYAQTLLKLADIYIFIYQDTYKAENIYYTILEILEDDTELEFPDYIILYNGLAYFYEILSDYKKAEFYAKKSLEYAENNYGKLNDYYASSLNNLAILYEMMGVKENEVERMYLEALMITEKTIGKLSIDYSLGLYHLGKYYLKYSQYEKAESLILEALSTIGEVVDEEDYYYGSMLLGVAEFYKDIGRYEEAIPLLIELLHIEETFRRKKESVIHLNYSDAS